MAEWLAARGHQVRVVTAPPYYPIWQIGVGYSGWVYGREERMGVRVFRCPVWVPSQPTGLKRIVHLASFAISSLPVMLWQGIFWRPDIVWVVEPPLFCAQGALLAGRLGGSLTWLHVQDFEVDAAFDLGILSGRPLRRLTETLERWVLRRFTCLSTISDRMIERLIAKGLAASRCELFPNWVDTDFVYPLEEPSPMRDELKISKDTIVALYAGNLGKKQGLERLVEAARLLVKFPGLLFVICGDGVEQSSLKKQAEGLPNVRFLSLQPPERLNDLLNLGDIHLLPQSVGVKDLVLPSKLTAMLACGRPVVAEANEGTQVAQIISRCGLLVLPGDVSALAKAIVYLSEQPKERDRLGKEGRSFALQHWKREVVLGRFEETLSKILPGCGV